MELNVLVACEESQAVTKELRALGHNAFSCDLQKCSGGHEEWHINGDVLALINGNCSFETMDGTTHEVAGKWDLLIAFPPCTHLAVSGSRKFEEKFQDGRQREAIEFFAKFVNADCDHICIENPNGIISGGHWLKDHYQDLCEKFSFPMKWTQRVQPYQFGHTERKTTCLWLKNLPKLEPTEIVEPNLVTYVCKGGKKRTFSSFLTYAKGKDGSRSVARSKTFPGIAKAMGAVFTSEEAMNLNCGWVN